MNNITEVGHLDKYYSLESLKELLAKAKPGDVLIASSSSTNHFVVIRSVLEGGSGICVYDANWDRKNGIRTNALWQAEDIRRTRPIAVTLYRYVNYISGALAIPEAPTLSIDISSYPTTLDQGDSYPLRGTITSNYNITSVTGSILNSSRKTVMSHTQNPNTTSFNIRGSAVDMNLKFASLSAGTYTLKFTAENSAGTSEVWSRSFTVEGAAAPQTYTVTFDARGGSVSQSSVSIEVGASYQNFPTPTYPGYRFVGWGLYQIDPDVQETTTNVLVRDTGAFDFTDDVTLYASWAKIQNENSASTDEPIWNDWSGWSATPVTATSTRQVETRTVKVSDSYTQYRYGRYASNGHDCWCAAYLQKLGYGQGSLNYSEWTTTRYSASGKDWSCGYCSGDHQHVDHTSSNGTDWWKEYRSPSGQSYYWEETQTIPAVYETQYRYRDRIS